jgi:hypothetical protein
MLGEILRHLLLRRYDPQTRDFVSMGRGIEARYARCHQWWERHLEYSREFIARHLPPGEKVLVIGAGRLLDIDLDLLRERYREIHLLDADPSCVAIWKARAGASFGGQVKATVGDCTEVIQRWTQGLAETMRPEQLAAYLAGCRAVTPTWSKEPFDGIISLNILGQIPLYWRDRVLAVTAGPMMATQHGLAGLAASMGELQRAHLEGARARKDRWSLIITDTEYYFYQLDKSDWRVEPALFGPCSELVQELAGQYQRVDRWLWHVSPQFVECDDEGEIHRVEAFFTPRGD